jgi:hypothetical protein
MPATQIKEKFFALITKRETAVSAVKDIVNEKGPLIPDNKKVHLTLCSQNNFRSQHPILCQKKAHRFVIG